MERAGSSATQREARDRLQRVPGTPGGPRAPEQAAPARQHLRGIAGSSSCRPRHRRRRSSTSPAGPGAPTPEPSASDRDAAAGDERRATSRPPTSPRTASGPARSRSTTSRSASSSTARSPAGRRGLDQRLIQSGFYAGKTCHRLATRQLRGPPVRLARRHRRRRPRLLLRPDRERAGRRRLPGRHDRHGAPAQRRLQQRPPVLHRVPTTPRSPTDAAGGYTVVGTVTSGLDEPHRADHDAGHRPDAVGADGTGAPAGPATITAPHAPVARAPALGARAIGWWPSGQRQPASTAR